MIIDLVSEIAEMVSKQMSIHQMSHPTRCLTGENPCLPGCQWSL